MTSGSSSLPVGAALPDWSRREPPKPVTIEGRICKLEPLDAARHGDDLVAAFRDTDPASWTYLFAGPFTTDDEIRNWLGESASAKDAVFFTLIERKSGRACGVFSLMRADPANGVIEVGGIHYSDLLKRTAATTEAMFLVMRHVFEELGYRRYEWKCNALNGPSRRTALRLGFRFEGIFRNHMMVKGHNRDTAWFSIIDIEWPALKRAFEGWLAPENFDRDGGQRRSLADIVSGERI